MTTMVSADGLILVLVRVVRAGFWTLSGTRINRLDHHQIWAKHARATARDKSAIAPTITGLGSKYIEVPPLRIRVDLPRIPSLRARTPDAKARRAGPQRPHDGRAGPGRTGR